MQDSTADRTPRDDEGKFRFMFEHSLIPMSFTSPDGRIEVNQAFLDLLGYTCDELAKETTWRQITHPEDAQDSEEVVAGLLAGARSSARFVKRYVHKDGHMIWTDVSTTLRRNADGTPEYFITSVVDISESKRSQEALAQSRDMIVDLTDMVPGVVYQYRLNPDGSSAFPFSSRGMHDIYGVTPEEVREDATRVFGRLHPEDLDRVSELISESARTLTPFHAEFRVVLPTQGVRWRLSDAMPQRTEDGGTLWHGIISDITDRKRAEEEIMRLNEELEQRVETRTAELTAMNQELIETNARLDDATRAKSEFLASMSHELRTPLNSIIGFSGLLLKGLAGPLNEEQLLQIGMVSSSGHHLLSLVDDVLDLARIESGGVTANVEDCDAKTLATTVLEELRPLAEEKGLAIEFLAGPGDVSFASDSRLVRQILTNLVGNAVKYTDSGTVSLAVSGEDEWVVFAVSDTGRGISESDLPHITERFYQAPATVEAKNVGTGLGLAISSHLAEMLGARINATSEVGVGSTFALRIPRRYGLPDCLHGPTRGA